MRGLRDKVVLVTGGGHGREQAGSSLGQAMCVELAKEGAKIVVADLTQDRADATAEQVRAEGGDALALPVDVVDEGSVKAMVDAALAHYGRIDVLVNNAGVFGAYKPLLEIETSQWEKVMDVDLKGVFLVTKAVLPSMLERGDGAIINMSSVAGSPKGVPNRCAYSISKAAVVGLTKSIAADYVTKGIRCNAICPGTVDSPSLQERLRAMGDYETARAAFVARQPIGRIGTPEEIADLAVYLAGATYTTGQIHIIDGGWVN